MKTEKSSKTSSGASAFPDRTPQVPTHPSSTQPAETEKSGVNNVANRLAHKANQKEQEFDQDNSNLFTK